MVLADTAVINHGFETKSDNTPFACNGIGLKNLLQAGNQWLEAHVNVVNGLNVYPVPDGDTGTNMVLTMRSVLEKVEEAADHQVGTIAGAAAQGALMGARGNSGVILSQFLQGLADGLAGQKTFTAKDFARATQSGVEQAYKSVINPVEGTILTVAREASEAAVRSAEQNDDLVILLTDVVERAKMAQARTPELLPVLKEAGVTDSGGQGLVYILEGGLRFLKNEPVDVDPVGEHVPLLQSTLGADEEAYGYDVQFLIEGNKLNVDEIRARIDRLGWSTFVVGDEHMVKVHVHTSDPGVPLSYGVTQGIVSDVVVENMEEQAKEFVHEHMAVDAPMAGSLKSPASIVSEQEDTVTDIAVVCVVPGQGLARIFRSLGANQILAGGQTMNPSTQELLDAVNQVKADKVLILPNNSNVILAAQQAQSLAEKQISVVSTRTLPQGIAALLSFNYQADLETNARRMLEAAQQVVTIEVTQAVRDTRYNGFRVKTGDVIGLFNSELVSVGQDEHQVVLDILSKIDIDPFEIVTIYFGQNNSQSQAESLADKIKGLCPDMEVEVHDGGQPHYHYIISLE